MVPLALFSFGVAFFLVGGIWWGSLAGSSAAVPFSLIGAALGGIIAGILAFRASNVFGGVAMSVIGTLFGSSGLYFWLFASAKTMAMDLAWIAFAWTAVVGLLALASFKAKIPVQGSITFIVFFLSILLWWVAAAFHVDAALKAAGIAAIVTAVMWWIGGFMTLTSSLE